MSKRITLVDDPSGNVLFSGVSVLPNAPRLDAERAEDIQDLEDLAELETCPETKRSPRLESGPFPSARVKRSSAPSIPVEMALSASPPHAAPSIIPSAPSTRRTYELAEGPATKRGERAA